MLMYIFIYIYILFIDICIYIYVIQFQYIYLYKYMYYIYICIFIFRYPYIYILYFWKLYIYTYLFFIYLGNICRDLNCIYIINIYIYANIFITFGGISVKNIRHEIACAWWLFGFLVVTGARAEPGAGVWGGLGVATPRTAGGVTGVLEELWATFLAFKFSRRFLAASWGMEGRLHDVQKIGLAYHH